MPLASEPDPAQPKNVAGHTKAVWCLAALSYCLLAASMALPVLGDIRGWYAWLVAWLMLLGSNPLRCDPMYQRLLGASSLAIWVVVFAATPLLTGRGLLSTATLLVLFAALGLGWILVPGKDPGADLAIGYYLWELATWLMAVACGLAWLGRRLRIHRQ